MALVASQSAASSDAALEATPKKKTPNAVNLVRSKFVDEKSFFALKIGEVKSEIDQAKKSYGEYVVKADSKDTNQIQDIKDETVEIEKMSTDIDQRKRDFDKAHGVDIKKIAC